MWRVLDSLYHETWLDRDELRLAVYGVERLNTGQERELNAAITLLKYRKLIRHFCEDVTDAFGNQAGPFGWMLSQKGQRFYGLKWGGDD